MCDNYIELMSLYIDGMLNEQEKIELENHINSCDKCKQEFEAMKMVVLHLQKEPQIELPENFHDELMCKLKKESSSKKINYKAYTGAVASFAITVFCLSSVLSMLAKPDFVQNESIALSNDISIVSDFAERGPAAGNSASAEIIMLPEPSIEFDSISSRGMTEQSIDFDPSREMVAFSMPVMFEPVRSHHMTIEVENIDTTIEYVNNLQGTLLYSSIDINFASMTKTVPEIIYLDTLASLRSLGDVVSENGTDIRTNELVENLNIIIEKKEQERIRLEELLSQIENVSDRFSVEERISQIENEIMHNQTRIDAINEQLENPTITISILESPTPNLGSNMSDLGHRMEQSFIRSINNTSQFIESLTIFIIGVSPIIAVLILILFFVIKAVKKVIKK